jgi:hypothetical protein
MDREMDQTDKSIWAQEISFLKKAVIGATIATAGAFTWDRLVAHTRPPVLPFGQPWLSIVGGGMVWAAAFAVALVGRLAYLAVKDPYR